MTIKVLSFNVQNGHTVNYDYALLGRDIRAEGAQLVGLQELDRVTRRNGGRDALCEIAAAAGFEHYAYTRTIDYMGGEYGTGILSAYPILRFEVVLLESHGDEQRCAGVATVKIDGKELTFINTHLSLGDKGQRQVQFEALARLVAGKTDYIITGDFNTDDFSEFAPLGEVCLLNREDNRLLSYAGQSSIDNIVTPRRYVLIESFIRNEAEHSDHFMIGGVYEI